MLYGQKTFLAITFFLKTSKMYFNLHKIKITFLYDQFMFCLRKFINPCYF